MEIVLVSGMPASGKTTYAKNHGECFSFDVWVKKLFPGVRLMQAGFRYSQNKENFYKYVEEALEKAKCVPVLWLDNGAVLRDSRVELVGELRKGGVSAIRNVHILADLYTCIKRNNLRSDDDRVDENLMYQLWAQQEFPSLSEGFDSIEFVCTEK